MSKIEVPADFPRVAGRGAISGFQPKVLLRENNGVLTLGAIEEEILSRYEYCLDLVEQLNVYCQRKLEQNPEWTVEFLADRTERGLRQKVSSGEWPPLYDEEIRWIVASVSISK